MCPTINENQMYYELNHIVFLLKEMMDYCDMDVNKKNELTEVVDKFYYNFLDVVVQFDFENRNSLY